MKNFLKKNIMNKYKIKPISFFVKVFSANEKDFQKADVDGFTIAGKEKFYFYFIIS